MARIITICNQKGGVAKTTTAINIAAYLAIENKRTLLVDLDPQSNATSGVGIDKHTIESSIYSVLHEYITIDKAIKKTAIDNLHIVPSNLDLTGAEIELVNVMSREHRLRKAIEVVKNEYDFVIIDCPPSLGLLTINALTASDSILIPIQCEYYALEGLSQLINTIKLIKENINSQLETEGVLLTMADFRTNLTKEVIDEVKKYFGDKVYKSVIPRTIKLTEAPGFGKPIAIYDNTSVGALAYHNVTKELLQSYMEDPDNIKDKEPKEVQIDEEKEKVHGEEVR